MSYERDLWIIAVGSWTGTMGGSPLGESLGVESGSKGGSYGDISGGNIESAELGDSST